MTFRRALPAVVVALVLVPSIVQPGWRLVATSLAGGTKSFAAVLTEPAHLGALWRSLLLSLLTVAACALVGIPLAFFVRGLGGLGKWLGRLALAPLFLSPVLGTIAFYYLLGPGGVARHFFPRLELEFRGLGAVLVVHVLTMFVYFFLFTSAALERLDWELLFAARSLGARRFRAYRTVVLPLLGPAAFGAAALTFMASMASFTAPYVFDTDQRYLTTAIVGTEVDDPGRKAALAIVLTTVSVLCALVFQRFGRGKVTAVSKGWAPPPARPSLGTLAAKAALSALVVAATLLPLATLVLLSFKPRGSIGSEGLFANLTAAHYDSIFGSLASGERTGPAAELVAAIGRSLVYAAVATVANVAFALALVLGVPAGWPRTKRALEALSMLPIAIPGTVLALAFVEAFSGAGPFGIGPALTHTFAILPFAYFVRNIPVLVQATTAAAAQLPPSLPEASRTLGRGPLGTLFRVTLPLILPGVAAGALMAFLIATGEFVASYQLFSPSNKPAAVAIFDEYQYDRGRAAASGTLLIVVVLALSGLAMLFVRRKGRGLSAGSPLPAPAAGS
jgi:iron(III) transport system permease protein